MLTKIGETKNIGLFVFFPRLCVTVLQLMTSDVFVKKPRKRIRVTFNVKCKTT